MSLALSLVRFLFLLEPVHWDWDHTGFKSFRICRKIWMVFALKGYKFLSQKRSECSYVKLEIAALGVWYGKAIVLKRLPFPTPPSPHTHTQTTLCTLLGCWLSFRIRTFTMIKDDLHEEIQNLKNCKEHAQLFWVPFFNLPHVFLSPLSVYRQDVSISFLHGGGKVEKGSVDLAYSLS